MTDFAQQVRHQQSDYIVRSLMDIDFYKLTMGQYIHTNKLDNVMVRFKLINRNKAIPLARIIPEQQLRDQLDHVETLQYRRTDIYYLRGMDVYGKNMFSESYIDSLKNRKLSGYSLSVEGDQFNLEFYGPWQMTKDWETIALAILSELYYRNLMKFMSSTDIDIMYGRATDKLFKKLRNIRDNAPDALISDFGQRRRHSFLWQRKAIEMCQEVLGAGFVGTSNTWMAFNNDLVPIGTNAHELPMVLTAIAPYEQKRMAQYDVLRGWGPLFNQGLRIMLPDTYGSEQFYAGMPDDLRQEVVTSWRGQRQDSGDPRTEATKFIEWLRDSGLHSDEIAKKTNIFSDGLNDPDIIELQGFFRRQIITPYGWGTNLTNDFIGCVPDSDRKVPGTNLSFGDLFRPFSVVIKVSEADGNPAVKLSNNINKATGDSTAIEMYKEIFSVAGIGQQEVTV